MIRKFITSVIMVLTMTSPWTMGASKAVTANPYVSCKFEVNKKSFRPGSKGELLITLTPVKGIHINLAPAITVELDSGGTIVKRGTAQIPGKEKFLDVTKSIRQPFFVSPSGGPAKVAIKGTITYYYCSDAEGWCSKFKQPFELSIIVVQ